MGEKLQTVLVGDIHGEFEDFRSILAYWKIADAYIIQVGDFGMGFKSDDYYARVLSSLDEFLGLNNNHLYAFRGNHDAPRYFQTTNNPFDCKNITFLADYSELELLGKRILCIGGAVSIDRIQRVPGRSYWEDEPFVFNETFFFSGNRAYDVVLTHTRPGVCGAFKGFAKIADYLKHDPTLKEELIFESKEMDKVYELTKPAQWFYGHFHDANITDYENTRFRCLDINEVCPLN